MQNSFKILYSLYEYNSVVISLNEICHPSDGERFNTERENWSKLGLKDKELIQWTSTHPHQFWSPSQIY